MCKIKESIQGASPWGLLGCWICVPLDASNEEIIEAAKSYAMIDFSDELIADRLYGGFGCENPDKRHIFISAGQFTYTGNNSRLISSDRINKWVELIEMNEDNFKGDGPFTEDAPKEE